MHDVLTEAMAVKNLENANPLDRNYVVVKYQTNYKKPMRKYYQFVSNIARFLGIMYSVEEIEDGFLFFYERKIDFIGSQLNPINSTEIEGWIQFLNIDLKEKSIQNLLKYIKNLENRPNN